MTYANETNVVGHPIGDLSRKLAKLIRSRVQRRKFKRLLDLEDHMLDDIGVTRAEVMTASRLPLSVNAATELRRISLERRRNRM